MKSLSDVLLVVKGFLEVKIVRFIKEDIQATHLSNVAFVGKDFHVKETL
jgi:hypothetical protein